MLVEDLDLGHPGIKALASPFQIKIRFSKQSQSYFFQVLHLPKKGTEVTGLAGSESLLPYFRVNHLRHHGACLFQLPAIDN